MGHRAEPDQSGDQNQQLTAKRIVEERSTRERTATSRDTAKHAAEVTRTHRRVSRPATTGTDTEPLEPQDEPREASEIREAGLTGTTGKRGENDARLMEDVPPHWQ